MALSKLEESDAPVAGFAKAEFTHCSCLLLVSVWTDLGVPVTEYKEDVFFRYCPYACWTLVKADDGCDHLPMYQDAHALFVWRPPHCPRVCGLCCCLQKSLSSELHQSHNVQPVLL